jgi:hypothetical protein
VPSERFFATLRVVGFDTTVLGQSLDSFESSVTPDIHNAAARLHVWLKTVQDSEETALKRLSELEQVDATARRTGECWAVHFLSRALDCGRLLGAHPVIHTDAPKQA